jgi:peptidoglycan/LPS O-acetylase OafA/YrhL
MILSAILLFTLAAAIGLYLIILGVRYHRNSRPLALSHAGIAILALGLLITEIINGPSNKFNNGAVLLLLLTLTGGAMLFALRERNRPPPMPLVAIHVLFAGVGLMVLVIGFQR